MKRLLIPALACIAALFVVAADDKKPEPTTEELKAKNGPGENWEGPHVPELMTMEDMEKVFELSKTEPIFIFKHSTTCPICARAAFRVNEMLKADAADGKSEIPKFYFVKVVDRRPISQKIAELTGVKHESPQVLLITDGKSLWDSDHEEITAESIEEALAKHVKK